MKDFKTKITVNGKSHDTLADILPDSGQLKILFIAKTPAPVSVDAGHYFQGRQGKMFWNKLADYGILNVPSGRFEDEYLTINNYGLTDIVKVPRNYGNEPSDEEYKNGVQRILNLIEKRKPKVIVFVYKKVLDNIVRLSFGVDKKSKYGFNSQLEKYFNSKVFVFPMPGTPCTTEEIKSSMSELVKIL
jgi:mismatch-specific thymine-DNA glycosylase